MENLVELKRNEFIRIPPSKEMLVDYFNLLNDDGVLYLVFLKSGPTTALCYEKDNNDVFTYRAFIDKDEAEFYANYIEHKNKFPVNSVKVSFMQYNELIKFMDTLKQKNPNKFMKMSVFAMLSGKMTAIDTLWTNFENYMV